MAADSVKELKKQRGSYLIMLDSGDSLRVPLAVFRALPLREGEPVDIAAYRQAQLQAEYPLAMERAGRVLSQRDYSEQMLERKLLEVGWSACGAWGIWTTRDTRKTCWSAKRSAAVRAASRSSCGSKGWTRL